MAKNKPTVYSAALFQSDLPQRLRASTKACRAIDRAPLLHEAADWIEKLEQILSELTNARKRQPRRK
jgi:hypothetical protein